MTSIKNLTDNDIQSHTQAKMLCQILYKMLNEKEFTSINDTIKLLNDFKQELKQQSPLQFTIRNIIQKVQMLILEIIQQYELEENKEKKQNIFIQRETLKEVEYFIDQISQLCEIINQYAEEIISNNELIVTMDYSDTILNFLIEGSKTKKFEVIVVQVNGKIELSNKMAQKLQEHNIQTALVLETAIFAIMQRANKVIIGSHAIMQNGGALCQSVGLLLAIAAQSFSVPVIIISAMYKLTPKFPINQNTFNELVNPAEFFQRQEGDRDDLIEVYIKKYNYIAPELISLYITNLGKYTPGHIFLLFNEYYGSNQLQKKLKKIKQQFKQ